MRAKDEGNWRNDGGRSVHRFYMLYRRLQHSLWKDMDSPLNLLSATARKLAVQ